MRRALGLALLFAVVLALSACVVVVRPPAPAARPLQLHPRPLQNPCARVACREAIDTRKIA